MLFGSRTFVPVSWMCKTQTSVSHSSIESEVTIAEEIITVTDKK